MDNVQEKNGSQAARQHNGARQIIFNRTFTAQRGGSVAKSIQSQLRQVGGDSRMSAWGLTGLNHLVATDFHSFQFTAMNIARVISTRSGSSPSINMFFTDQNRHAISRFNLLDHLPTHRNLHKGIGDRNPFIKESNFGANEEKIGQATSRATPCNTQQRSVELAFQGKLNGEGSAHQEYDSRHEKATPGPKDFQVTHLAIISPFISSRETTKKFDTPELGKP